MDNSKQMIKTKVQDISSKDLSIDFAEPKVILVQSIIRQMIRKVLDIIEKELSYAQPKRKTGKWNFIGDNMFECTSCGVAYTTMQLNGLRNYDTDPYAPKFCPNCGADMRGEQE